MKPECIDVESIGEIADLSPDDPQRQHAENCPRCGALLDTYSSFVQAEPVTGSNPADADARLAGVIRDALPPVAERPKPARKSFFRTLLDSPAFRPALAATTVVVVVVSLFTLRPDQPREPALRGGQDVGLVLNAPDSVDEGVQLSWGDVTNADAYEVRLYASDLTEIARFPVTGTSLLLTRDMLPAGTGSGTSVLWRVMALQTGDPIDVSPPATLQLP